jgi:hypothetical protein
MWKEPYAKKKELGEPYLNMRPEDLLIRKMGFNTTVDAEELARAKWFWERRPKNFILSTERALVVLIFYAVIWMWAMWQGGQGSGGATVLAGSGGAVVAAMLAWAGLDAVRFARWNSAYSFAILRLLHTAHRQSLGDNSHL